MNTENNKIIAIFMNNAIVDSNNNHKDTYNYHNDWNWLMEVVEKIEGIGKTELKFSIHFENVKLSSDIQVVYNACVEFIKWYNNQNSAK